MGDRAVLRLIVLGAGALVVPTIALASGGENVLSWEPRPLLTAVIVASALFYGRGVIALWRKAGVGHGIHVAHVVRFALGWLTLAVVLLSPFETLADGSFALHMIQHEALIVVAAPLLTLSRPLEAWAWGFPSWATRTLGVAARPAAVRRCWRSLTDPVHAWCLHALALWVWHIPLLFDAALAHETLHVLQHTSFLGTALAFWWALSPRSGRAPDGTTIACLFTTMLHTSALGALLTVAPSVWYGYEGPAMLGLSALEDQQLGGLVMWVPGSLPYLVAGLAVVRAWLSPARKHRTRPTFQSGH
jgi:putative membrane protein